MAGRLDDGDLGPRFAQSPYPTERAPDYRDTTDTSAGADFRPRPSHGPERSSASSRPGGADRGDDLVGGTVLRRWWSGRPDAKAGSGQ